MRADHLIPTMEMWKNEDSDGNPLSDKEAEDQFITWYNDICEERVGMLEAEEAYKKRVKDLEEGLENLLKTFDEVEGEVKFLRNKYEASGDEDGDIYREPYDVIYKERNSLKEEEMRLKRIIKLQKDENDTLKYNTKRMTDGRCTQLSLDIENNLSEMDFSSHSNSPRYGDVSNSSSNTTDGSIKRHVPPLALNNHRNNVTLETPNSETEIVPYNGNTTHVYTRKNILTYRHEIQALLDERIVDEERLAAKRYARARNHNEAFTVARHISSKPTPVPVIKYSNAVRHLRQGLVVVTETERLHSLEQENKALQKKLKEFEKERNALMVSVASFQHQVHETLNTSGKPPNGRRSVHLSPKTLRQHHSQFQKVPKTDRTYDRRQRLSSPVSLPSIDSNRPRNGSNVTFYSVYSDGYLSKFRRK